MARELQRRHLLRNVQQREEQLHDGLQALVERFPTLLQSCRGWGLLQGLVMQPNCDHAAVDVVKEALKQRLLLVPAGPQVVRMVPPLVINQREVNTLLKRLDATLSALQPSQQA